MGVQPDQRMTSAAAMAASEPRRSPATCRIAARRLRLPLSPRERIQKQSTLTMSPAAATASMMPPATGCGSLRRWAASTTIQIATSEEREAVDEGGEDGEAVEAVGPSRVGRAAGEAEGEPGQRQRRHVGEHVAGVGEERERAGEEAAGDLDQHEAAGEDGGEADGAGAGGVLGDVGAVVVAVMVVVVVGGHRRARASVIRVSKSCGSRTAATSAASTVTPQRSAMAA